jgi:hypothetical protein
MILSARAHSCTAPSTSPSRRKLRHPICVRSAKWGSFVKQSAHVRYCPPVVGAMLASSAIDYRIVSCGYARLVTPPTDQDHKEHAEGHNGEHDYGSCCSTVRQREVYAHQSPRCRIAHYGGRHQQSSQVADRFSTHESRQKRTDVSL